MFCVSPLNYFPIFSEFRAPLAPSPGDATNEKISICISASLSYPSVSWHFTEQWRICLRFLYTSLL